MPSSWCWDIGKLQSTYTIDIKMVDCASGRISESFSETYKGDIDGLIVLMEKIAKRMAGIEEKIELEHYRVAEHMVRMAKARAYHRLMKA